VAGSEAEFFVDGGGPPPLTGTTSTTPRRTAIGGANGDTTGTCGSKGIWNSGITINATANVPWTRIDKINVAGFLERLDERDSIRQSSSMGASSSIAFLRSGVICVLGHLGGEGCSAKINKDGELELGFEISNPRLSKFLPALNLEIED
jgi:hypothetical protein